MRFCIFGQVLLDVATMFGGTGNCGCTITIAESSATLSSVFVGSSMLQVVLGPHVRQPARREERDLALGLALQQVRPHDERRAQLGLLDRVRELDVRRLVVIEQIDIGQRHVRASRDVDEQLA